MMGVPQKPKQGRLENICNRIKVKNKFIRICYTQLKVLNATIMWTLE